MKDLKYKRNIIIIFLVSIIVYLYLLLRNDAKAIFINIININFNYILLLIAIIFIYLLIEGLTLHLFTINKVKGISFWDSFIVNLVTQFFSGITPFASGGQPFQVIYLNKRGVKTKDSTSIVMMNFIVYNITFCIIGFISLVWKYRYFNQILNGKGYLLILGFAVNTFVTVITFILGFSKKIYYYLIDYLWVKIINWKILKKFNLAEKTPKIKDTIDGFNQEIKALNKNKKLLMVTIFLNTFKIILFYAVPIIIFISLGVNITGLSNYLVGAFFIAMIMAYIPIPGGSLGAEGSFNLIYLPIIGNQALVVSAMILWRFMTYYLFIVFGALSIFSLNYKKNLSNINYHNESVLPKTNIRYTP